MACNFPRFSEVYIREKNYIEKELSKRKLLLHFKSFEKQIERAFWGDNIKPDTAANLFLLQIKKEISDGNLGQI